MKRIYITLLAVASLAFALTSCKEDVVHQPGEADVDGCYGVYFPSQDEDLTLDPSDSTVATITVARANTSGAITVPYTFTGDTDVISASEISFADGQSETTCKLTFDNAEVGVSYTCHFLVTDEKYASKYNSQPVAFDYTVIRDKWNSLGMAKFTDTWMFENTYEAELIQNDKNNNIFRLIDPYSEGLTAEGYYPDYYKDGPSPYIEFRLLQPGDKLYDGAITITKSDLVYFANYNTGYYHTSYNAEVMAIYPGSFSSLRSEENLLYNKVLQYQSNGLPAGVQLAPYFYMNGVGGWNYTQSDGVITIVFPGAVLTDYTLALDAGISAEGQLPVKFTLGSDVAEAKYAVYEGSLNVAQIEARVADISDGTETNAKSVTASGVQEITLDKTGKYTLVAVTFDADKNAQESTSVEFCYVAAGDEVPVVVNCGLTVTDRYTPEGYTSENSLEYYVYGSDVVSAKIGLYKHTDVLTKYDDVVTDLESSDPIKQEDLDSLNASGLASLFTKLSPGTAYDLLVWASNGYENKIISASATTNGDPLPIYQDYSIDDYISDLAPEHSSGLFGTWNLYGIDENGNLGMREYLGKVTLSQSDTPTAGPDDYDLYDEYVYASGFAGSYASQNNFDDKIELDYYGGILYFSSKTTVDGNTLFKYVTTSGNVYNASYILFGIPVADGYVAFIFDPQYDSYGFNGTTFCTSSAYYCYFSKYLLVDPAKDDNGVAPASVNYNAVTGQRRSFSVLDDMLVGNRKPFENNGKSVSQQGVQSGVDVQAECSSVPFSTSPSSLSGRTFHGKADKRSENIIY